MIVSEIEKLSDLLQKRSEEYDIQTDFGQNQEKQKEFDLIFNELR